MERETTGGSETIERIAVSPSGGGKIVFPLIEIDAGLLAGGEIGMEDDAVHGDFDGRGWDACERAGAERELLFGAHGSVVALPNAAWREQLFEEPGDNGLRAVHALRESLENERVTVLINDKTGQTVGFAKYEPEGVGVLDGFAAMSDCGGEAGPEEGFVEGFDLTGKMAERDLRGSAEMRGAEGQAAGVKDGDGIAGAGVFGAVDVGGVNPDVAGGETISGPALNPERRALHVLLF